MTFNDRLDFVKLESDRPGLTFDDRLSFVNKMPPLRLGHKCVQTGYKYSCIDSLSKDCKEVAKRSAKGRKKVVKEL